MAQKEANAAPDLQCGQKPSITDRLLIQFGKLAAQKADGQTW
jgi:hypothetical protein